MPNKPLTAKQASFVEFYTTIGADTYNNGLKAAVKAGYSEKTANNCLNRVLGNVGVMTAIEAKRAEGRKETLNTVAAIRNKHIQYMLEAEQSGDKALARLNLQDLGRTYAAYTDKAVIDSTFSIDVVRFSKEIGSTSTIQPIIEAVKAPDRLTSGKADETAGNAQSVPEVD